MPTSGIAVRLGFGGVGGVIGRGSLLYRHYGQLIVHRGVREGLEC